MRAGDLLGDPVDVVLAHAAVAVRVVGGGDERLAEVAPREHGNVLVEHAAEVVQPALADERERLEALGLVDVVEHAELVARRRTARPPALVAHSDDHGVEKLGKSVRPPSTKIVWPVM